MGCRARWLPLCLVLCACGDETKSDVHSGPDAGGSGGGGAGGQGGQSANRPPAAEDWSRDIVTTGLELDLAAMTGRATITLASADSEGASFEIGDLTISSVRDSAGALQFVANAGQLDVGVPANAGDPSVVVVDYAFAAHSDFDGWIAAYGVSLLWPYHCGNLFPCKSTPAEGVAFSMDVAGIPTDQVAIFPRSIPADAPSYMPGVAVAAFQEMELGDTSAGTDLRVWYRPGEQPAAAIGTAHLLDVFDFYETAYGAYTFGPVAGSVSVDWGVGSFGGMEHHPFWHVSSSSLDDEIVHAHEAAHGWFGNGVRIACWEDFVLSEGTVTYMAARALEAAGVDAWSRYECDLDLVCTSAANTIVLPETCGAIDIAVDPLWSSAPYYKGAFFFRDVASLIGAEVLDEALSEFYTARVGSAARMQELLDHIATKTDAAGAAALDQLADDWLRTVPCPIDTTQFLCP